jgi:succinate dehydrogenase/fumarate reductase flavoprotein subunit
MTEEKITDKKVSRRQFVGTAAAGAAALGAGALLAPKLAGATVGTSPLSVLPAKQGAAVAVPKIAGPIPVPSSWDGEADVIVVGLGGAGAAATLMAAAGGASVLVLEKAPTPGGSTALSHGAFVAAGTVLQTSRGIPDSPGKMFDFCTKLGEGQANPEVLLAYCEHSAEAWLWLANLIGSQVGVTNPANYPAMWEAPGFSGNTWVVPSDVIPRAAAFTGSPKGSPTTLPANGAGEFAACYNAIKANPNIQVMLGTPAVGLVTNNGVVAGVQAIANDSLQYFKANRGVVISAGGFSWNDQMSLAYAPINYYATKRGIKTTTGDGIRMGQMVGADLEGFGSTAGTGVGGVPGVSVSVNTSIYVNNRGQRFENETGQSVANSQLAPWQICGWVVESNGIAIFAQDKMQAWAIFDSAGKGSNTLTAPVVSAATIPALATALGITPTALTNTVNLWNTDAANNVDTLYGRPINFFQLSTPPYYAAPIGPTCSDSEGGLRINANTQVLDTFGNPIPHLYAAGTSAGGVVGKYFPLQGISVGSAFTQGWIAGKKVAAEIPWE